MASVARRSGRASGSSRSEKRLPQGIGDEVDAFSEEELARRPEVRIINKYAVVVAYIRIGMRGIGALALLWATVVLLGGFVSTLRKTDFWFLTVIAFVQAAGLSDRGDDRFRFFTEWISSLETNLASWGEKEHHNHEQTKLPREIRITLSKMGHLAILVIFFPVGIFSVGGPIICYTLSLIRVLKQDYGIANGDASKANLKPALDLFYYVSLVHGALYILFLGFEPVADEYIREIVRQEHGFSDKIIDGYMDETKKMAVNNPASTKNWNLVTYGAGLLDSQLPEDYSSGGRVLVMLIDQDMPVPIGRVLIRSPGQRIQKLIRTLAWRSPEEREMRWLAARTVEHLAGDLSLVEFPGALQCISSLLDNSCHNNSDQEALHLPFEIEFSKTWRRKGYLLEWIEKKCGAGGTEDQERKERDEDLVLAGLRILENLAHNGHNCTVIYSNKALLSKLLAPFSSNELIEDLMANAAWTKVVDGSLKVVSRLMSSPESTGAELHDEIASDANAVKNLEAILDMDMKSNSSIMELQIRAIEVLSQLVLHHPATSIAGTREHLIERALHFFLNYHWMEDYFKDERKKIDEEIISLHKKLSRPSTGGCMDNFFKGAMAVCINLMQRPWSFPISKKNIREHLKEKMRAAEAHGEKKMEEAKETASRLKEKAGEALAMLSMRSHGDSGSTRSFTRSENVIHCLTELLDSNSKTIQCGITATETVEIEIKMGCRISAAVILKHSSHYLKEPTLMKVLVEFFSVPSKTSTPRWWEHVICCIAADKKDEENPSNGGERKPPTPQSHRQQSEERRLKAELLSLITAIRTSSNLNFASVLLPPEFAPERFVGRLKEMVNDNRHATPACLAILKLTCEIVIEFIQHDEIIEEIKSQEIIDTLLEASKRMAGLEANMLFAGIDRDCYGVPLKPLSCVRVKQAQDLLAERTK